MSRSIFPIEVGVQVFMQPQGNAARHNPALLAGTVSKIARKYFYVQVGDRARTEKFERDTFESKCEDCNSRYILWPTEEAYQESARIRALQGKILGVTCSSMWTRRLSDSVTQAIYDVMVQEGLI